MAAVCTHIYFAPRLMISTIFQKEGREGARERGNESGILHSFGSEEEAAAQMVPRCGGAERRNQEGGSGRTKRAKKGVEGNSRIPESSTT